MVQFLGQLLALRKGKSAQARAAKDWAASDAIRDRLLDKGITLKDGAKGTVWEFTS